MRRVRSLLKFVGVALCVAPILSVAYAQQGSSQGDLLLEISEMRREIAELRDMVERQQFQMRKLQRSQATAPSVNRASDATASQVRTPSPSNQLDAPTSASNAERVSDTQRRNDAQTVDGVTSDLEPSTYSLPAVSQPTVSQPTVTAAAQASVDRTFGDPAVPTQERVEERVITAPPLPSQSGSGYPPVVDRSVGSTPVQAATSSDLASGNTASGSITSAEGANPNAVVRNTGAISSVPRPSDVARAQESQSVYQQTQANPNYRQSPSSSQENQPAGQVEQAVKPGGVVAIPPVSVLPATRESEYGRDYGATDVATADTSAVDGIPAALSESDYYRQGFDFMKQSNFDDAVSVFEKQLAAYPRGESADDAHYWIAEAMYVSRNLDVAKKHLRTLIQEYPRSRRVPDAMLKTAYIEQQQGNQIEARILFQEIVNFFPKSDAAIAAKNRLADSD